MKPLPSRVDCREILGASNSWTPMGFSRDIFTFIFYSFNQILGVHNKWLYKTAKILHV